MQLVVEAAGVTNGFAALIASPQRRRRCLAVSTRGARPPRRTLEGL